MKKGLMFFVFLGLSALVESSNRVITDQFVLPKNVLKRIYRRSTCCTHVSYDKSIERLELYGYAPEEIEKIFIEVTKRVNSFRVEKFHQAVKQVFEFLEFKQGVVCLSTYQKVDLKEVLEYILDPAKSKIFVTEKDPVHLQLVDDYDDISLRLNALKISDKFWRE